MTTKRKIRVWCEIDGVRHEATVEEVKGYEGLAALNHTLRVVPHGWRELEHRNPGAEHDPKT